MSLFKPREILEREFFSESAGTDFCDLRQEAWMRLCYDIRLCFCCKVKPRKEQRIRQLMLNRIAGNKQHHFISLRDLV